jgi:tetratricopeptide (TPR) repeat protein
VRDALPSGPVALVAARARPPDGLTGAAIQVPFAAPVGAALFSRGTETYVVFDERRPIDLAALRGDPVFGSAVVTIYPAATVIRLVPSPGQSAVLSHGPSGWRVSVVAASPRPAALVAVDAKGEITFAADSPGQVVGIADPATGGTLLVGTQRKPGQAVLVERRTSVFILPVTGQGIVVEPLSDAVGLHVTAAGFTMTGPPAGLVLSAPVPMAEAMAAAARLTRLFEFPGQATDALAWRARQQEVAAAMAPPLARGPKRYLLAESLVGLGLGVEAQTLLKVTEKDDPLEAASPDTIGLAAIAALLAGRPAESGDLSDPRLTGTDEIALWRAIQTAMTDEGSARAASVLATTAPLLLTYPEELRRRVLPLALETMILGGQPEAAARLLEQRQQDPGLAYARALLKQAQGDNEGALALFDKLANSRSTLDHARASIRAIELRLAMGKLDTKGAADAMDSRLDAWRGDDRDLAVRRRLAALREKAGEWREAFAVLRDARRDFPGRLPEIDRQMKEAFAALPQGPELAAMPAAELIGLLEENAELMPEGPDGEAMRAQLAEKLMALDLPKRADPVLTKLMRAAPLGPGRAGFGATLATVRLNEGDSDGALVALSESNSADMPDPVRERRAVLIARVQAKRGDAAGALEALAGIQSREADETRAAVLEQAHDWPAATDALAILAARVVPAEGVLNDEQRAVVLRLATAAERAGDNAELASLREKTGARIGAGPDADMFRLLTEAPVRGTADLVRSRAEMGLARSLTANTNPRKPPPKNP